MKNIFRILMAVAVLFTASCAKEDISSSIAGGEANVTFTVDLPELGTRAYGLGVNADILYYNVFEAGTDNQLSDLCSSVKSNTGTFTFSLVLLKGMKYDLVFWAQDEDCGYYSLAGKQITVNYNNVDANDDTRDAFFKYVENFDPTVDSPSFKLYRPFAQLNAAVSAADMTAVSNNEVTLTTSTVTVDTYTGFDISTGDVTGNKSTVTFNATTMPCNLDPAETLKADYTYVSMNYLLVPKIGMVSNVEFTFNATKSTGAFAFTGTSYNDVPLKQNFRTNILGALLTKPTEFNVEIEAGFNEPAEDVVIDAASLQEAINNAAPDVATEITLGGDIDLSDLIGLFSTRAEEAKYGVVIPENKEIILNLGGYTLSQTKECTAHYAMICNKGVLTIVNGTVSFNDEGTGDPTFGWGSYTIENRGNLIIEEGAVVKHLCDLNTVEKNIHMYCAIQQASGTTTVNGGVISTPTYRSLRVNGGNAIFNGGVFEGQVWMHPFVDGTALTINGGEFAPRGGDGSSVYVENASKAVGLTVNGGYFATKIGSSDVIENAIHGGLFGVDPSNFKAKIAQGCTVVEENGLYRVSKLVAEVAGVDYSNLAEAIAAAKEINGTVKLLADITTTDKFVFKGCDVTIDLNGKTLAGQSSTTGANYNFLDANGGTLTVKNGTITCEFLGSNMGWSASTNVFNVTAGGVLNLTDVTAKNLGGSDMGFVAHLNNWGEVTLNVENSTLESNYVAVRAFNSGYDKNNITINKSTLKGGSYAFWVHNFTKADFGTEEKVIAQYNLLNLEMFNNGNIFVGKNDTPIRLGMTNSVYCAADVNHIVATPESLKVALTAGGKVALANDIVYNLEKTIALNGKELTLNGNGFTVSQAEECNNSIALIDITGGKATIENVVFDGIKNGAVVRTVDTDFEVDNVTTQNCTHNVDVGQGLFRLRGKNTIKNSTFKNNTSSQGQILTLNYDGGNPELPQVVENCVFEGNTANSSAIVYYVKGSSCTINANKFVGNTVNCNNNGATVYMGFQENCVVTNNIFKNNTVNEAGTSRRVAGALMIGYAAEITGNAFIGNKVTGERAVANDVCASAYYTDIDLSGNYWGGLAPKENDDYFNEYPDNYKVIVNGYLSSYIE